MLRLFAHSVACYCMLLARALVAQSLPETGQTISYVQKDSTTSNVAGQECCVCLHGA